MPRAAVDRERDRGPRGPEPAEEEAREAQPGRYAAREQDGLERVPQYPGDEDDAGGERETVHPTDDSRRAAPIARCGATVPVESGGGRISRG